MCADDGARDGAEPGVDELEAGVATTLEGLCAANPASSAAALAEAQAKWRRHGLVVFPELLSSRRRQALLEHVRAAQHGNHTRDYTAVTRDKSSRVHKSLPVDEAKEALVEIATAFGPFLRATLGTAAPALLEGGFMCTAPGAAAQLFHRDVAPSVVSCSSMAVSIQVSLVDTDATQGALEVIPGSHGFDPKGSDRSRQEVLPHFLVGVPAGSVTVYALYTMHRGSANTHTADRPFYFFTLVSNGLAPPGLAYTIEASDIGQWQLSDGRERWRSHGEAARQKNSCDWRHG